MNYDFLTEEEYKILCQLAEEKDLPKIKVLKQALRLYQLEHEKQMGRWKDSPPFHNVGIDAEELEHPFWKRNSNGCYCRNCNPLLSQMIVCPNCGNKRCPKALNHIYKCTNSNAPDQIGVLE